MISMIDTVSPGATSSLSASNALERRSREVEVHVGHGTEAAALDEHRLLVQHLRRLQHLALGREHRRAREPELHEPQAHHAIVDVAELVARELDEVDLDAVRA